MSERLCACSGRCCFLGGGMATPPMATASGRQRVLRMSPPRGHDSVRRGIHKPLEGPHWARGHMNHPVDGD
eukprot:11085827-Alexandrium_andersonii.AAC.1